jgi:DNA-binding NarL/FixJ family response regulator
VEAVKLVVVDDHALFRAGLVSLLREMESIDVVGEAENGLQALDVVRNTNPDVVLLDVNMPIMNGVETVRSLKMDTDIKIIMLTISRSDDDLLSSIVAGADGYLLKNS